ncbi:MAG: hypothetical protein C7B47_16350 [Sulfobacillus thermosulfidooxidans]|uniref:Uncharacterized protein n=1 Tax=Sulfobacillus thermosulfidooxidans TaxID=28034 RepID=A0A2T2WKS7_SULTH|nr:MAG: hypothetical protein C7B47_16350 [Sulfobacillus thermosulfidooxidans]
MAETESRVGVWTLDAHGLMVMVPVPVSIVTGGQDAIRTWLQHHGFPATDWHVVWSVMVDPPEGSRT